MKLFYYNYSVKSENSGNRHDINQRRSRSSMHKSRCDDEHVTRHVGRTVPVPRSHATHTTSTSVNHMAKTAPSKRNHYCQVHGYVLESDDENEANIDEEEIYKPQEQGSRNAAYT